MNRALVGAVGLSVAGASLAIPSVASGATHGPAPRAVFGSFAGASRHLAVAVYALPSTAQMRRARSGVKTRLYRLPARAVSVAGSSYSVAADAAALPASVKSAGHLVTFTVVARDLDTGALGLVTTSSRYAAGGWQRPILDGTGAARAASGTRADGVMTPAKPAASGSALRVSRPAAGSVKWGASKNVWAVIGTGYPALKQTSWMDFDSAGSSSYSTTLGVAASVGPNAGASYSQRGTRSVQNSFGFTWNRSGIQRAYQVGVTYRHATYDLGPSGPGMPRYIQQWVPMSLNGGTSSVHGLRRPNFSHCRPNDSGTFRRYVARGRSYQNAAGVHLYFIDASLSSERSYSRSASLFYTTRPHQLVCGSNADPALAGSVMEKGLG